jgi:vacuolar-type H+-ATPase subunit F/Vma7
LKKVVFITPRDVEFGFQLAGVSHYTVEGAELEETLGRLISEEAGLVVIDERLLEGMEGQRLRDMEKRWSGLLLVLPAPEKPGLEVEDYALALIRRAIGYHVRLRL